MGCKEWRGRGARDEEKGVQGMKGEGVQGINEDGGWGVRNEGVGVQGGGIII